MTNNDEDTSRQAESLWRSDDWADLRWAREHSTPQQTARHLLDPQWRNRDYNALDELVEMTHDADLSSLSEDDLETLAASSLPELRQSVIRYKDTPARLLEDMARTESNTRLLQMLVESGKLGQNTIDLCCWNQTDSRLAASMLPKASDHLLVRLSGRDWWPSRKNAVESGRLDRARLSEMIEKENHPDVVSALIGTGEFDMDGEAKAIRRVITSPDLLTAYTNPMGRRYNLDRTGREVVRQAARTMLEHAPIGLILSMPDDDNENWRTLIDTAATEYADEINPNMLGLIAQAEGNNQTKTILGERLGKDTLSGTDENQTPTASPGTGGTYGFNLRLLGRLKADVDYFLGPSHAEKYLWAGSVDAQIAKLREIDGSIRPEDRPEWFTAEWIDQAEQAMRTPADGGVEDALDAALSGQYAAFENAIIGYIDAYDPDAGTRENGASQFAGYEVTDRVGNSAPTSYRLDWFDDDGRVAVLLPHGVLFRGGAEAVIRKYIVHDLNRLDAVIGLAPNLFHGTSIPVCLLVLKSKHNGNSGNVLFIDASKELTPGKNQNTLEDKHIEKIVDAYTNRVDIEKFAHVADMAEIEANDWNLNLPRYVDTYEEEEPVDLEAVRNDIKRIEGEKKTAVDKAESMLRQLGL